jgi:hypothetical protein
MKAVSPLYAIFNDIRMIFSGNGSFTRRGRSLPSEMAKAVETQGESSRPEWAGRLALL